MIVKSPQKLKTDLEELERKKRECAEEVESCKIQIEEKKKLIEQISQDRDKQEARHKKLTELVEIKIMIQYDRISIHVCFVMVNSWLMDRTDDLVSGRSSMKMAL